MTVTLGYFMKFVYEVFQSVEDFLMVASNSVNLAMRHTSTIYTYGGYIINYSPLLSGEAGESLWIVSMVKGSLQNGLLEFDPVTRKVELVPRAVNPEKTPFLVVTPAQVTVLDEAISEFENRL